jgi:putative acetyltransferase
MLKIRPETVDDFSAVHNINQLAFGRPAEADLVDALRLSAHPHISLVAELDSRIVGHIFFSPVTIAGDGPACTAMGLAPMAVLPQHQHRAIGSALVREGLDECRRIGYDVVVVLGHPHYYPRFGFRPAKEKGLRCEYKVPDEVFMVAELRAGAIGEKNGLVKYHPEFNRV